MADVTTEKGAPGGQDAGGGVRIYDRKVGPARWVGRARSAPLLVALMLLVLSAVAILLAVYARR